MIFVGVDLPDVRGVRVYAHRHCSHLCFDGYQSDSTEVFQLFLSIFRLDVDHEVLLRSRAKSVSRDGESATSACAILMHFRSSWQFFAAIFFLGNANLREPHFIVLRVILAP